MLNKKFIRYLILAAILAAVLFTLLQTKPIPVDMVKASSAPMKVTLAEEGKTRVIERFVISAPIDAYMHRISFNEGDSVSKGQTLLTLEPLASSVLDPRSRSQAEIPHPAPSPDRRPCRFARGRRTGADRYHRYRSRRL